MNHISLSRAEEILNAARGKRIAVLGDYMLDRHLAGSVRRISPEAPVPVVEIESESTGLGGAGNVVQNLGTLGVHPPPPETEADRTQLQQRSATSPARAIPS